MAKDVTLLGEVAALVPHWDDAQIHCDPFYCPDLVRLFSPSRVDPKAMSYAQIPPDHLLTGTGVGRLVTLTLRICAVAILLSARDAPIGPRLRQGLVRLL